MSNWDVRRAAKTLSIDLIPFDKYASKNPQYLNAERVKGYSYGNEVAIRPGEQWPVFTAFHEFAHVVLGHTTQAPRFPQNQNDREVEAHVTALILATVELEEGTEWDKTHEAEWLADALFMANQYSDFEDPMLVLKANQAAKTIYQAGR